MEVPELEGYLAVASDAVAREDWNRNKDSSVMVATYAQLSLPARMANEREKHLQRLVIGGLFRNFYMVGYPALADHDNNRWVSIC